MMTIIDAIKQVMLEKGEPLTAQEAYDGIMEAGLYDFHAEYPNRVVAGQIRRHCKGIDFPTASETKHFELCGSNKYFVLPQTVKSRLPKYGEIVAPQAQKSLLHELKRLHSKYDFEVRHAILSNICKIDPKIFEVFAKKLLEAYGFVDVCVTRHSKDGGIDGYGKLKVGLAHLNVAFQCKRYSQKAVSRVEIDTFRGAAQGQYEQGIFFTTSRFAAGAELISFRAGAVPIVLIDGPAIVELMIEKQFGVQIESMPVYSYALDVDLTEE